MHRQQGEESGTAQIAIAMDTQRRCATKRVGEKKASTPPGGKVVEAEMVELGDQTVQSHHSHNTTCLRQKWLGNGFRHCILNGRYESKLHITVYSTTFPLRL